MPPKKLDEPRLQAVVLCDSYLPRFLPLTKTKPRCLLPLANTPLIEYTLEFLVSANVSEVYLMCCSFADQVTEYIKSSKWISPDVPFKLETIELPQSVSVGDALRDLDARGIINSDFLLISGDVVCNVDFGAIWRNHQKRKQEDKNCIMTIVLRQGAAMHRTRSRQTGLFIVDDENGRLVSYKKSVLAHEVNLDATELLKLPAVAFRNDLIDCRIDVCTPDVPALFTENFDYEHLRNDFVNGVLTSDLLGKTIYTHILDEGYAARVESFKTYKAVSKDIISRYSYPLVVDSNEMEDQTYTYHSGHIYKEKDVVLSQSCVIGRQTAIGGKTTVGALSNVSQSVIGRNCRIGSNVVIKNSYILDSVTVGDGASIEDSIIGSGSSIGEKAIIKPNSVIGFNFHVEDSARIHEGSLLSVDGGIDSDNDDNMGIDHEDEAADEDEQDFDYDNPRRQDNLSNFREELDFSDDSIVSEKAVPPVSQRQKKKTTRSLSTASAASGMSVLDADDDDDEEFLREAVASINRSIVDKHTPDVAVLELNTLRMTMNAPHDLVVQAAVHALISHIGHLITQSEVKDATTTVFGTWTPLLKRITFDFEGQVHLISCIETECARRLQGDKVLVYALMAIYDTDVISEEAVLQWWKGPPANDKVRSLASQWVDWLENAEEESEDE